MNDLETCFRQIPAYSHSKMVCLPCGINQLLFYIYCLRLLCSFIFVSVFRSLYFLFRMPFIHCGFSTFYITDYGMRHLFSLPKKHLRLAIAVTYWAVLIVQVELGRPVCVCVQLKSNLPNNKQLEQAETREAKDIRERDRDRGSHFKDDTHTFPFRSGPHSRNNVYQFLLSLLLLLLFFFVFVVVVVA